MMEMSFIEWAGSLFGILGALLLALNTKVSGWGFVLFLISNVFWIAYGMMNEVYSLLVMQAFFTATSLLGVKRWLFPAPEVRPLFRKLTH